MNKYLLFLAWSAVREDFSAHPKHQTNGLVKLADGAAGFDCKVNASLKFRRKSGAIAIDASAALIVKNGKMYLRSRDFLQHAVDARESGDVLVLYVEEAEATARVIARFTTADHLDEISRRHPELRLSGYDIPPVTLSKLDTDDLVAWFFKDFVRDDPELFNNHLENFLKSPHIISAIFDHVFNLSSEENISLVIRVKQLAEQIRWILTEGGLKSVSLTKIKKDHATFWPKVRGQRIAFLDGGMSTISGFGQSQPLAVRVGIYSVIPGEESLESREKWTMHPYIVGDTIERHPPDGKGSGDPPDRKRLSEAARYVLEAASTWRHLEDDPKTETILVHGPLVNQFVTYNSGKPYHLPCLREDMLEAWGISSENVSGLYSDQLPISKNGRNLWSQFMPVYGYVLNQLFGSKKAVAGVVERSQGRWIFDSLCKAVVKENPGFIQLTKAWQEIVVEYELSDDFIFGCVLREGEYVRPVVIEKNPIRRAVPDWQGIVSKFPSPFATVLKTSSTNFPFRVELNCTAASGSRVHEVMGLIYHSARLLPRYAFPVGLHIVDQYAKIPDWLSRGVTKEISALVLRKAASTGDANVVAAIRQYLAHTPRDFFYRPKR